VITGYRIQGRRRGGSGRQCLELWRLSILQEGSGAILRWSLLTKIMKDILLTQVLMQPDLVETYNSSIKMVGEVGVALPP